MAIVVVGVLNRKALGNLQGLLSRRFSRVFCLSKNLKLLCLISLRLSTVSSRIKGPDRPAGQDLVLDASRRELFAGTTRSLHIGCQAYSGYMDDPSVLSIHSDHIKDVHDVPMKVLIRPFPSELDECKVMSLMRTLEDPTAAANVPPVDIMWVKGRLGGNYYYSFGGCHRYEAHKRLNRETIRSKLIKGSVETLKAYLGSSTPDLK